MPYLNLHSGFASATLAVAGIVTSLALLAAPAAQAQPQPQHPAYGGSSSYSNHRHGPDGHGRGPVVRCESLNGRYRECRVPFHGPVVLVRQLSDARCSLGRTYGSAKPGRIWVNNGCRGDFAGR
jgi:hypothetical protein